jgi:hypothetical protein
MNDDKLQHIGVLGMKWGHRKSPEESSNLSSLVIKKNAAILKKNPNAAVINYSALKDNNLSEEEVNARIAKKKKIRNIAIGVGIGLTIAAGTYLYVTHKEEVDTAFGNAFDKIKNKKIEEVEQGAISKAEIKSFKKLGFRGVDTEQEAINANWMAAWSGHDKHRYDVISDDVFNHLDDTDLSLKPGQILKRITTNAKEVLRDNTYVSFEEDDNNRYAAFLPAMFKVNNRLPAKPKVYSVTMEALDELKSPSAKKRVEILAELVEKDALTAYFIEPDAGIKTHDDAISFAKKHYNTIANGLVDRSSPVTQKYIKLVKEKGYNALVDDNDAGRLTKTPLILLKSVAVKSNGITDVDPIEALAKIKPMTNENIENSLHVLKSFTDKFVTNIYYNALYSNK